MKRTLSLVLALVMVLGSFTSVFAAGTTVEEKAGAFLKEAGVLVGNTTTGDLMLKDGLARQDAVVLVAKLMGEIEVAQKFPTSETSPTYKDIKDNFYLPLLAWAQANKTFEGHSAARFGFGENLTAQEYAKVLLVVLGYEVGADKEIKWENVLDKAEELGLLADIDVDATFVRGNMAVMTLNALAAEMNDSTITLAEKLNIELPTPELSTDIEITSAKAIANNKVEVKVEEEVAASKADFTIVKKGSTTEVEIKVVVKESAKVFVIETEALVGGTAYTVTANGKTVDFTGIAKDTTAPTVNKFVGVDSNLFEITFSDKMDYATATNVENYAFSGGLKVVKAELNAARNVVELTTDAAKRNVVYTVTVQNVTNTDGVVITKTTRTAVAREDRQIPRVTTLQVQNNEMMIISFVDETGMNKSALEDIANYSINDLNVVSATAIYNDDLYLYDRVVLKTETQQPNKAYTLTIENLVDDAVLANPLGKQTRNFRGAAPDVTAPVVNITKPVHAYNNNKVFVYFTDHNAIDRASAEDISNYVIKDSRGNVLAIESAELLDDTYPDGYSDEGRMVTLTTVQQEQNQVYRLEVKGVMDEFGNALKPISGSTYATYNFNWSKVDTVPPHVTKVEFVDAETVRLYFNELVVGDSAVNPTNYSLGTTLGHAISATKHTVDNPMADIENPKVSRITLKTHAMANNAKYTVTFSNIEDRAGNIAYGDTAVFYATSRELDTAAPVVSYAYAVSKDEIHIKMDERIKAQPEDILFGSVDNNGAFDGASDVLFKFKGRVDGGTTLIYTSSGGSLQNRNYKIKTTTSGTGDQFTDLVGNKAKHYTAVAPITPDVSARYVFSGLTAENTAPQVLYVEQLSPVKVAVYFSEYVAKGSNPNGFNAPTMTTTNGDLDYSNVWNMESTNPLKAGQAYAIAAANFTDPVGKQVEAYSFYAYYEDSVAPTLVDVKAINKSTVELTFDESIKSSGTYRIYRLNPQNVNQKIDIWNGPATVVSGTDRTVWEIGLTQPLNSQYTYFLEPTTGSVDYSNNRELTSNVVFTFLGTDKEVGNYITGVKIINANTIEVYANGKTITGINSLTFKDSAITTPVSVNVVNDASITGGREVELNVPVLQFVEYTLDVQFGATNEVYKFKGNTPDYGIRLNQATPTTATIDWAAFDSSVYTVEVIEEETGTDLTANISINDNGTATNGTDDVITITGLTLDNHYYVVLKNDIGSVVYAYRVLFQ